jgi:hypothetical protein
MQYAYGGENLQYTHCTKTFPNAQVQMGISVQTHQQATTPTPGNKPLFIKDNIPWGLAPAWPYCDHVAAANENS